MTPQGNQVFNREGPYIDGYGLKFKRQPAAIQATEIRLAGGKTAGVRGHCPEFV